VQKKRQGRRILALIRGETFSKKRRKTNGTTEYALDRLAEPGTRHAKVALRATPGNFCPAEAGGEITGL
jgi:hypothetical protein